MRIVEVTLIKALRKQDIIISKKMKQFNKYIVTWRRSIRPIAQTISKVGLIHLEFIICILTKKHFKSTAFLKMVLYKQIFTKHYNIKIWFLLNISTIGQGITRFIHNKEDKQTIDICETKDCYQLNLKYNNSLEEIKEVMSRSSECKQYIQVG